MGFLGIHREDLGFRAKSTEAAGDAPRHGGSLSSAVDAALGVLRQARKKSKVRAQRGPTPSRTNSPRPDTAGLHGFIDPLQPNPLREAMDRGDHDEIVRLLNDGEASASDAFFSGVPVSIIARSTTARTFLNLPSTEGTPSSSDPRHDADLAKALHLSKMSEMEEVLRRSKLEPQTEEAVGEALAAGVPKKLIAESDMGKRVMTANGLMKDGVVVEDAPVEFTPHPSCPTASTPEPQVDAHDWFGEPVELPAGRFPSDSDVEPELTSGSDADSVTRPPTPASHAATLVDSPLQMEIAKSAQSLFGTEFWNSLPTLSLHDPWDDKTLVPDPLIRKAGDGSLKDRPPVPGTPDPAS